MLLLRLVTIELFGQHRTDGCRANNLRCAIHRTDGRGPTQRVPTSLTTAATTAAMKQLQRLLHATLLHPLPPLLTSRAVGLLPVQLLAGGAVVLRVQWMRMRVVGLLRAATSVMHW